MLSVSTQIAREDDLAAFKRMLASVSFADEILIFNMERSDLSQLHSRKVKIIDVNTPHVVEEIRARQITEASGDWVLIMDFDEVIPPALAQEIKTCIKIPKSDISAYAIYRDNYSLGFRLRHGGWGTDNVIRLFRRSDFLSWPTSIHSTPTFRGQLGQLHHPMEHHKDASLAQMVEKTNRYSDVEAKLFFDGGIRVSSFTLFRKPLMEFVRRYFLKLGLLDGRIGLIQSLYQSYSVFITYAKLYELQNDKK